MLGAMKQMNYLGQSNYWINSIQGDQNTTTSGSGNLFRSSVPAIFDNGGNSVMGGTTSNTGSGTGGGIIKFNQSGQQVFAYRNNFNGPILSIALDPAGNIYATGATATTDREVMLYKFNSSGSILSTKLINNIWDFNPSTTLPGYARIIYYPNNNGIIVVGQDYENGNPSARYGIITVFDSTLAVTWSQRLTISDTGAVGRVTSVCTDGSNIYALLTVTPTGGAADLYYVVCYNSSGTLQWQKQFTNATQPETPYAIAVYNNDLYAIVRNPAASGTGAICKFAANTGNVSSSVASSQNFFYSISADNGSIYAGGGISGIATVAQFDNSLNLTWINGISATGTTTETTPKTDSTPFALQFGVTAGTTTNRDYYTFNVPPSGSATGTYTFGNATVDYLSLSNVTVSSSNIAVTAGNLTNSAYTMTVTTNTAVTWSSITVSTVTDTI